MMKGQRAASIPINLNLPLQISNYLLPVERLHCPELLQQVVEYILAWTMIVILSPVMLTVAIFVKIISPGDVIYSQVRVGRDGKKFNIYKFRSMVQNAEQKTGAILATENDNRITWFGNFLRKSHLDELPQLFNVIRGDMSFIGPRPERPVFVDQYNREIIRYRNRNRVRPGITGMAQIYLPYDASASEKLVYDLIYIQNRTSLYLNIVIIIQTIKKMLLLRSPQPVVS
ncbi:MAG: sugar transferase [Bdellovibrionales bacterium]|jgi:lipopolysaccharide/colanic/teichoic acid biosynthesis glycosyltransferase|nr:sugar transferase [Bdellovibrionales bacterium]MBT3524718.1 sugar transferase [Bdellovibrionales bacterium]MBT7668022.1 sugar transferase [Bdellovibrionales bacterium]MBT7766943.1 sugar transferase [Bdellovibrionales bacterium]